MAKETISTKAMEKLAEVLKEPEVARFINQFLAPEQALAVCGGCCLLLGGGRRRQLVE